ncbi:flagellar export chaperone FliS [Caldimonas sp. KR1-144]|uniref:flagellar export chaperone FliS n=1 Tax=Caldimonas sp. KR1-144 TaxID=3400911 RepID=UPI003C2F87C1
MQTASPSAFMASRSALAFASTYRSVGVETGIGGATPHQLVAMLYTGLLDTLAEARGAMRAGQVQAKGNALTRAVRIVDEGLKAALSPAGGELSQNLDALYGYISVRLTQANLRNDEAAIDECVRLIEPLREAWASIRPQADAAGRG